MGRAFCFGCGGGAGREDEERWLVEGIGIPPLRRVAFPPASAGMTEVCAVAVGPAPVGMTGYRKGLSDGGLAAV